MRWVGDTNNTHTRDRFFAARLLRSKHVSNTKNHVFGNLSARCFQRRPFLHGTDTLLVTEQSGFESRSRGCAEKRILAAREGLLFCVWFCGTRVRSGLSVDLGSARTCAKHGTCPSDSTMRADSTEAGSICRAKCPKPRDVVGGWMDGG